MNAPLEFHPLASLFPLMEGEAFEELVADIKANGLREPITIHEEKILDGRNRYRACIAAGVGPLLSANPERFFLAYAGQDPLVYVLSANLHRRHLTTAQRAASPVLRATGTGRRHACPSLPPGLVRHTMTARSRTDRRGGRSAGMEEPHVRTR